MADTGTLAKQLEDCAGAHDFEGAFRLVRDNQAEFAKAKAPAEIRDALKATTTDRLLLSFLDGVGFGERPLAEAVLRLEKLVSFQVGVLVLSKAWGLGKVQKLDYFYRRITVDFKTRKGHQFTYDAAADMLDAAPENHILVLRERDPDAFKDLIEKRPGDFVKEVLSSYGDMPIVSRTYARRTAS